MALKMSMVVIAIKLKAITQEANQIKRKRISIRKLLLLNTRNEKLKPSQSGYWIHKEKEKKKKKKRKECCQNALWDTWF